MTLPHAVYHLYVDWDYDGTAPVDYTGTYDEITSDALASEAYDIVWGRGRERLKESSQTGTMQFHCKNTDGKYSPESAGSPLHDNLLPGKPVRLTAVYNAITYQLFNGFIANIKVNPKWDKENIYFYCSDNMDMLGLSKNTIGVVTPTVTTEDATGIGGSLATLNGTLGLDDSGNCDCGFEWGETTAYGNTTATQSIAPGNTFAKEITGLEFNTTYHFRAYATRNGLTGYGADKTFITPTDFTGSPSDGFVRYYSASQSYAIGHNAASGTIIWDELTLIQVGNSGGDTSVQIERGFIDFDTSSIPNDATILTAKLLLWKNSVVSVDYLCIVQGIQSDPLTLADYGDHLSKTTIGGELLVNVVSPSLLEIELNATGIGWINKTGETKFCLRMKKDIDAIQGAQTSVAFVAFEGGASTPALRVTWL